MALWPGFSLAGTTSGWPPRGGGQAQQAPNQAKAPAAEAEHEDPAQGKWQEVQNTGNRKPAQWATNSAESSRGSASDWRRPLVKVGGLTPMAGRTHAQQNLTVPLQSLVSCFLEAPTPHPMNGWAAAGAVEGLWQGLPLSVFWRLHHPLCFSSCYPNWWGFFCPPSSLCRGSGQGQPWELARYLAGLPASYDEDSSAHFFPRCFFLPSFSSSLPGLEPGQKNHGALLQALMFHWKIQLDYSDR